MVQINAKLMQALAVCILKIGQSLLPFTSPLVALNSVTVTSNVLYIISTYKLTEILSISVVSLDQILSLSV